MEEYLKENVTSALESVSVSLCLMSFANEKKTSSTFRFVLALLTYEIMNYEITY